MDIDINAQVSSLTVAKKQIVEIMHAINNNSRILIMDEPSAVLTDRELEVMFRIVKQLRDEGITSISRTVWTKSSACAATSASCATAVTSTRFRSLPLTVRA